MIRTSLFLLLSILCMALFSGSLYASSNQEPIGHFTILSGTVDILRAGSLPALAAAPQMPLYVQDVVRTRSKSQASITFVDGNRLDVAERSRIDIREYLTREGHTRSILDLPRGKARAIVTPETTDRIRLPESGNRFEIHTPNAVAGVRGTDYIVLHQGAFTTVLVNKGTVHVHNPAMPDIHVTLLSGQLTSVAARRAPLPPRSAGSEILQQHQKDTSPEHGKKGDKEKSPLPSSGEKALPPASDTKGSLQTALQELQEPPSAIRPPQDMAASIPQLPPGLSTDSDIRTSLTPPPPITETQTTLLTQLKTTPEPEVPSERPPEIPAESIPLLVRQTNFFTDTGIQPSWTVETDKNVYFDYRLNTLDNWVPINTTASSTENFTVQEMEEGLNILHIRARNEKGELLATGSESFFYGKETHTLKGKIHAGETSPALENEAFPGWMSLHTLRKEGILHIPVKLSTVPALPEQLYAGGRAIMQNGSQDFLMPGFWLVQTRLSPTQTSGQLQGEGQFSYMDGLYLGNARPHMSALHSAPNLDGIISSPLISYDTHKVTMQPLAFVSPLSMPKAFRGSLIPEDGIHMDGFWGGGYSPEGNNLLWYPPTDPPHQPVTLMGRYDGAENLAPRIFTAALYSQNYRDGSITSYDGGTFAGFIAGRQTADNMETRVLSLYKDPTGRTGIFQGVMGAAGEKNLYPEIGMMQVQGGIHAATALGQWETTGPNPETQTAKLYGGYGSFKDGGGLNISPDMHHELTFQHFPETPWGIGRIQMGGLYEDPSSPQWYLSLHTEDKEELHLVAHTAGNTWEDSRISGKTMGYYTRREGTDNKTGIYVAETLGTFEAASWQAFSLGVWMDTCTLLSMTDKGSRPDTEALRQLHIPAFEVGRATVQGGVNTADSSMQVEMKDMIFLAPSTGEKPLIWATSTVQGSYDGNSSYQNLSIPLSGDGLNLDFTLKTFDTTTGLWKAQINYGRGNLSGGSYNGDLSFEGMAAGTTDTTNRTFSGTGAGLVSP